MNGISVKGSMMDSRMLKKVAVGAACVLLAASSSAFASGPSAPRPRRPAATVAVRPAAASKRATGATIGVSGTVTDGSGTGWPLYARLDITSASTEPVVAFSDPATGAYAVDLSGGIAYTFVVTPLSKGYLAAAGPVAVDASPVTANWQPKVDAAQCQAPGYQAAGFTPALSEGFDSGALPPGWTIQTTTGASWEVLSGADPCGQFDGNRTGGTGPFAIVNSDCNSNTVDNDDSSLVTPPVDLSALPTAAIRWNNDYLYANGSTADVDVSIDGGATWTNVWERSLPDAPGPGVESADMSFAAGHAGVQARFHYDGFWAWWWQVDDVLIGQALCNPLPGGLIVGTVRDANTGLGLDAATVTNLGDASTVTTVATGDPAVGDGYYSLFAGVGAASLQASLAPYSPQMGDTTVVSNGAVRLDIALPAALLDASPRPVSSTVAQGGSDDQVISIGNAGGVAGTFKLLELNAAAQAPDTLRPTPVNAREVAAAVHRIPRGRENARDTKGLPLPAGASSLPEVPRMASAGNVIGSFPTGLTAGWGLAYDTVAHRLWISNPDDAFDGLPGDGLDYVFLPDGTNTGDALDLHSSGGAWQADGTYNQRTGTIWQVNVGGDNCLFEIDPVTKTITGRRICGPWHYSERGVAYDYVTDTYYVGGWEDTVIYHIDSAGNLLDSSYTGIPISGLAYNPSTGHLFATALYAVGFDVYVLDPKNNYITVGGFLATSGGVPVLQGQGVSLEADCDGNLWIYHLFNQVAYEVASGETGWCVNAIPWLTETPSSGVVEGGGALPVTLHFDASGLQPGLHLGQILFGQDTPYAVEPLPVNFTVLFDDVPVDSFAANYIYAAAGAGVMPGGTPVCTAGSFCPNGPVTRADMAGYIFRGTNGASVAPPVYQYTFQDVAFNDFNSFYIEGIFEQGITAGCGGGNYCPHSANTRAQMAVFLWKGQHGAELPPACTPPGVFADVACPDGFAVDYIEAIYNEGITAGCGNGNYCPNGAITNAQMAVFLVKAFHLPYLP